MIDLEALEEEYGYNDADDDKLRRLKEAINSLSEAEKRIIWLYAEEKSMRRVASHLRVSPATAFHYIHSVRDKIKELLSNDSNTD